MDIEEKLAQINSKEYAALDRAMIEGWRAQVSALSVEKDFVKHPYVQQLAQLVKREIKRISNLLANDRDLVLNPTRSNERASLFALKEAHEFYLSIFSREPDKILHSIEMAVDLELNDK